MTISRRLRADEIPCGAGVLRVPHHAGDRIRLPAWKELGEAMRGSTWRVESVLKVIPYDRWVDAAEIAAETGLSSHKVSGIIRRYLLFAYVEGKHKRVYRGSKLYRRLRLIEEEKKQ